MIRLCRNRKNAHRTHTNIHASVGFEPTIAVLERAKIIRALDRSTTAIGLKVHETKLIFISFSLSLTSHAGIFLFLP
jgi:hypothetical protein